MRLYLQLQIELLLWPFLVDFGLEQSHRHNHAISSTDAWNFLDVSEETKTRYFQLFSDFFPCQSMNPDSRTVFNMYTLFCKRFGSINGPDAYLKAEEFIEKLNEKAGEKIASIRQGLGSCRKSVRRCHQKSDASQDALKLVPDSSF